MERLWEEKERYGKLHLDIYSVSAEEISLFIEDFLPYERHYATLTQKQLLSLIEDANRFQWEVLDLTCCGLDTLPDEIGKLTSVQLLALGNNFFSKAKTGRNTFTVLPDTIAKMRNLEVLDLQGSCVTSLPQSIGQLSKLRYLDLYDSKIRTLPDSIENLSSLRSLHLGYCHLKEIPYALVKLNLPFIIDDSTEYRGINLTNATLDEGELSLFARPHDFIEAAYQNRTAKHTAKECKVIFLGDGAAGKSCLIERIVTGSFPEESPPTDGVKMTKWEKYPDGRPLLIQGEPLTIRFLDFGGQEIMHSMHRCFLTSNTVYVVVCESRNDAEIDRVAARWMETVKSFARDCPVILVLNKSDLNRNVEVKERDLQAIHNKYRRMIRASAKTGDGVEQLERLILAEIPDCLRKMTENAGFLGLKQELENMTEDYIYPDRFQERCDHYQIEESQRTELLNWFQDLGVAYTYTALLSEVYVLNPEWLTNGIYRLILHTPKGGFLPHSVIRETLRTPAPGDNVQGKRYSDREMGFILQVMRKFEISLEVERDVLEMIPLKMEKNAPPRYRDFSKADTLHLRWEAGYLPNNLIHRLMIRKYSEMDRECYWLTGAWFHNTDLDCEALAELSTERALDVYVRGKHNARVYMESFRKEALDILRALHIEAKEYIYCTIGGQGGRIGYRDVLKQYFDGKTEMYIPGIDVYPHPGEVLRENYVTVEYRGAKYPTMNINQYYEGGTHMNIRDVANSIFSESGAVSGNTVNVGAGDQKADFDAVAKALAAIKIPDPKKLAMLKKQLEALSKDSDLPMTAKMSMTYLLQSLNGLDENSQESGNKVWAALKPFIGDGENLSATVSVFGALGGKLFSILKAFVTPA